MNKKYTIFIIDDKAENLMYLKEILKEESYDIKATSDAIFAQEAIKKILPDLILLDIKMPELNGFELCKILKLDSKTKEIPIIFISALDDIDSKIKAFEEGGVDYITKPFQQQEVKARVKTQLTIYENSKTISQLLKQQDLFLKKIIHDMNTPLSIIRLNANSLENKIDAKDEFNAINASCKSLASIYEDLYYLSKKRKREIQLETVKLSDFISKRIMFFHELAEVKQINIELELSNEIVIEMDIYELERIIDNTISNAIKYSYENTTINIILENTSIKFQNHGVVIEDVDNVFEEFHQEKETQGFGLGLNIIKEISDKYQININLKSNKKYTEFEYNFSKILIR
jgi:signal transduction histidine kinase